jgi:prolyl-tRNA synthetase
MTHSDDRGLVLPPQLAPTQVVIVPIYFSDEQRAAVLEKGEALRQQLEGAGITVKLDARDTHKPGWKFSEYELRGVPVRLGLGPRDLENDNVELARRDTGTKEVVPQAGLVKRLHDTLAAMQHDLFEAAKTRRTERTHVVDTYDDFRAVLEGDEPGFVWAPWDGAPETEARIQDETGATIRCLPLDPADVPADVAGGADMLTGDPSQGRVLFAKAY